MSTETLACFTYVMGFVGGYCFAKELLPFQRNGFFGRTQSTPTKDTP